ncbi:MAG: NAD-dependent DNA ligase LigA [Bacteroides sp.]|nr:NAD-dependent DNA ligase LigA [Prevotella sp.]MCM1407474.1 NAD-dependent DNA ligase LigA [Treponema brennaborense]MCM1469964.1 NAD-dependent DNA ligase LigA [Bacteroides sp.]
MTDNKKKRIRELSALIEKYQKTYYAGEGEISDAEFDALWDELKLLDPGNSVLQKIGSDIDENDGDDAHADGFEKSRHLMPMGSQEKAADPEQFISWAEKHPFPEYLVEYKLDGASLELQYEKGIFVRAVTRGDGVIGDNITRNALKMQGIVRTLRRCTKELRHDMADYGGGLFPAEEDVLPFTGGVRGEVLMKHSVHDMFFPDKANCRNAANGLMKRKDGSGSEHLIVMCYDAYFSDLGGQQPPFAAESEKIRWLSEQGFHTVPLRICKSAEEVIAYRAQVMEQRKTFEYDIDGLVIKNENIDIEDARRARPDKQIAFKFSLEEAATVVRGIEWSESGATYTPVALFDTVELAGTKVSRASLANPNTIRNLNLRVGSHVVVTKRGEIIPKIESVIPFPADVHCETQPVIYPDTCAVCGSRLVDEGTRLCCPNAQCPKRVLHQLEKWISVIDIRDLGETLIKKLFEAEKVRSIADLYTLSEADLTPFFLMEKSITKEKKSLGAEKIVKSIQSHRNVSLPRFVAGFDIEGIGELLVEKVVAAGFDTLEKLLAADEQAVAQVNGFAEITARTLVQGLAENAEEMRSLAESVITISAGAGSLSGMSFCFTGELRTIKRADAESKVKALGGSVKSSVVKDLTYLVTNNISSGSSKNKKAAELGIPVIDELAFLQMLNEEKDF